MQSFRVFDVFGANQQLFDIKDAANREIFDRITQAIFTEKITKW